jgi:hypothetical protein
MMGLERTPQKGGKAFDFKPYAGHDGGQWAAFA